MINKDQLLEFFRSDEYIEQMNDADRYEVALACLGHSDFLSQELNRAIETFEGENK